MGAFAAFCIALPSCLRLQAGEGRSPYIHSDGILFIAAPRPAILWNSKSQVRRCDVCATLWRRDKSKYSFP
jgi:hypothetical protein